VPDSLANEIRCETRIRAECAQAARAEDIRLCVAQGSDPIGCRQAAGPARGLPVRPSRPGVTSGRAEREWVFPTSSPLSVLGLTSPEA
jgi:hypothetical protein